MPAGGNETTSSSARVVTDTICKSPDLRDYGWLQVLSLEEGMASLREERDKLKATLSGTGFKVRMKNTGADGIYICVETNNRWLIEVLQ